MWAKMSVLRRIMYFSPYLRSAMVRFPLCHKLKNTKNLPELTWSWQNKPWFIMVHGQKQKEKNRHNGILWPTDISCVTYRHLRNLVQGPVFPLSQIFCFALLVCFYAKIGSFGEKKCMVFFLQLFGFFVAFRSCNQKRPIIYFFRKKYKRVVV